MERRYLQATIGGHPFALIVEGIYDVLHTPTMTPIPLAPQEYTGLLNLRGKIITAIDLGALLKLTLYQPGDPSYCVISSFEEDYYSFIVEKVGNVFHESECTKVALPSTMDVTWAMYSSHMLKYGDKLLVCLDFQKIFNSLKYQQA
jgi:purine-binding chemotaxis protein CheW